MGDDKYVVLGAEMAAARAAESRHAHAAPSPLGGLTYAPAAARLWRWTPAPLDATVAGFVRGFAAADPARQAVLRSALTMDDLHTLLTFARRRSLAAVRVRDARAVTDAFDALSTIDVERLDWRDVSVAAMIAAFAARAAGVEATVAADGAIGRAGPDVAEILRGEVRRRRIDLSGDAGYRLVVTADGPVLVEDMLGRYRPDRDLLPVVLGVDAVLAAEGTYETDAVTVAEGPPEFWVGAGTAALKKLTGCASLEARSGAALSDSLTVHVAEARTDRSASELAWAADHRPTTESVVLGVSAGRLAAIMVVRNLEAGVPTAETRTSMARFRPAITEVLLRAR